MLRPDYTYNVDYSDEEMLGMLRVSAKEFQRNICRYQDVALTQPVTVTKDGRDKTVMLSAEEYHRLKRRDRVVLDLDDFTQNDVDAIARSVGPAGFAQFDDELKR
jgi:prevent-host-death family protein